MRVVIFTQGVSRVVDPLFDSSHDVVGMVESAPRGFSRQKLVSTIKNGVKTIASLLAAGDATLERFCKRRNVPYYFMTSKDSAGLKAWVTARNTDVIVVCGMSQLLHKEIFSIPKFGAINVHPSFLPKYRGPNPNFWQYYYLEMEPGVTVHYIDEGEDTGDIIFQKKVRISLGIKSSHKLDMLIGKHGVSLVLKALRAIENNEVSRMPQPPKSPTVRARNIERSEHRDLIQWEDWPIERVWHVMRGTEDWLDCVSQPGGLFKGQRWCVEGYEKGSTSSCRRLGYVLKDEKGNYVNCRDGKIRLARRFRIRDVVQFVATKIG